MINRALISFLSGILLAGCSSITKSDEASKMVLGSTYYVEKKAVDDAYNLLDAGHFQSAYDQLDRFIQANPHSRHLLKALLGRGYSLEGLERWSEALITYQQLVQMSSGAGQEFVAMAFYRQSMCFEALQQYDKAIMALADALRLRTYLSLEVAEAEIPARMAVLYRKINSPKESDKYYATADVAIRRLINLRQKQDMQWLGPTYIQMGSLTLNDLDSESFTKVVSSLGVSQKYFLKAIELDDPQWSRQAVDKLKRGYHSLWKFVEVLPLDAAYDTQTATVLRNKQQVDMAHDILESLEKLKVYMRPDEVLNGFEKEILSFVQELEKQIADFNYNRVERLLLTPQSQMRQRLKLEVFTRESDMQNTEEETPDGVPTSLPEKEKGDDTLTTQDPNL